MRAISEACQPGASGEKDAKREEREIELTRHAMPLLAATPDRYGEIIGDLKDWHVANGSADPEWIATIQSRVLVEFVEGRLLADIAKDIGKSPRTVARYVADLVEVFPPLAEWLSARTPDEGTLPVWTPKRSSRRWESAPQDGRWSEVDDAA